MFNGSANQHRSLYNGGVVSVGDFETGCPGFDPQSRHCGHGGVPMGKAHFLA